MGKPFHGAAGQPDLEPGPISCPEADASGFLNLSATRLEPMKQTTGRPRPARQRSRSSAPADRLKSSPTFPALGPAYGEETQAQKSPFPAPVLSSRPEPSDRGHGDRQVAGIPVAKW